MIRQFLDTSSGHLSKETLSWLIDHELDRDQWIAPNWHVAAHKDGWWVRVPVDSAPADFPPDLLLVCDRARTLGAEYILFDHNAEPICDLPFYER